MRKLRRVQQVARAVIHVLVEKGGTHRRCQTPPGAKHIVHRRRLISATDHTVGTFWIARLGAVILPLRLFNQLLEGGSVAILQQIAGLLPAKDVISRVAPGRALVVPLAHQELEKQWRHVELPVLLPIGEDRAEEPAGAGAAEEMFLIGSLAAGKTRGG